MPDSYDELAERLDAWLREAESRLAEQRERLADLLQEDEPFLAQLQLAHQLDEILDRGLRTRPDGVAVVLAAIDWRRAGCRSPVVRADLWAFARGHFARLAAGQELDAARFERGLAWATRTLGRPAPLVAVVGVSSGERFQAHEGLTHSRLLHDQPLPWEVVLARVGPRDAVGVGEQAAAQEQPAVAVRAWTQAIESGDPDATPLAWWHLGRLREDQGAVGAAREAFERAAASGHPDAAPQAMVDLAALDGGEGEQAVGLLERAVTSGHADAGPRAALLLGELRRRHGDLAGARPLLEQAAGSGHFWCAPPAAFGLGTLLWHQGDMDGARAALTLAHQRGVPPVRTAAAVALGMLALFAEDTETAEVLFAEAELLSANPREHAAAAVGRALVAAVRGDYEQSRQALETLLDAVTDDPTGSLVRVGLGILLATAGQLAAAEEQVLRVLETGAPIPAELEFGLGFIAERLGRYADARAAYQRAAASGTPIVAAMALGDLGVLCSDLGDHAGAHAALERAVASGHPFEAPRAAFNLGVLLRRRGRLEEARAAYQRAIDFAHPKFTADATLALGHLEMQADRLDQAARCYVQVITTAAEEQATIAAARLVSVLRLARMSRQSLAAADQILAACRRLLDLGEVEAASRVAVSLGLADDAVARRRAALAWRLAAEAGHPGYAPLARYRLGRTGRSPVAALQVGRLALHHAEHDLAVAALARAATAHHPTASPTAALELGRGLIYSLWQVEDAEAALRLAADTGGPTVTGAALAQLGRLYASYGNRPLAEATWRQGRRHPDPATSAAFTAERKAIGRVTSRYRHHRRQLNS